MVTAMIDGRFRLGAKIGKGSFGAVYAGIALATGLPVAIKLEAMNVKFN
jgi:serine/threonine protein kinase